MQALFIYNGSFMVIWYVGRVCVASSKLALIHNDLDKFTQKHAMVEGL